MSAAVIAARCESAFSLSDALKRLRGLSKAPDAGRVVLGADEDEVVEHHIATVEPVALGDELVLVRSVMNEKRIRIASHSNLESLPGANSHDPHVDPGLLPEERNDVAEQARLLSGGRGSEGDEPVLGESGDR